jgi:hypothetical protein
MANVFASNPIKVDTAFSTSYKAVAGALRTDSRRHIEDRKPRSVGHTPPPNWRGFLRGQKVLSTLSHPEHL